VVIGKEAARSFLLEVCDEDCKLLSAVRGQLSDLLTWGMTKYRKGPHRTTQDRKGPQKITKEHNKGLQTTVIDRQE